MHFRSYSVLALLVTSFAFASHASAEKVFRMANTREIESLDPIFVDTLDAGIAVHALFEGLIVNDPKSKTPRPGVAEKWELSKDNTVYTFHLRKNAKWSDGKPVTAQDFVYAWQRSLDPASGAYFSKSFYDIKGAKAYNKEKDASKRNWDSVGIKAKDDYTLEVTLEMPTRYFLELVSSYTYLPFRKDVVEKTKDWASKGNLIGNGSFTLEDWVLKDKLILKKSATYWNAAQIKLDKAVIRPVESDKTALNLFRSNELDWFRNLPGSEIEKLKTNPDFRVAKTHGIVYLRFNVTKPELSKPEVRCAIAKAIDRKIITDKQLREGQVPFSGLLTDGLGDIKAQGGNDFDVAGAKKLLASAGYPNGKGLPNVVALFQSDEQSKMVMTAIAAMVKQNIGINVETKAMEKGAFYDELDAMRHQIARSSNTAKYDDAHAVLVKFLSDNTYENLTGFKSAEYDKLVNDGNKETDTAKRNEAFLKAEKILVKDQCALIPLYQNVSPFMIKPNVSGIIPNERTIYLLRDVDVK